MVLDVFFSRYFCSGFHQGKSALNYHLYNIIFFRTFLANAIL